MARPGRGHGIDAADVFRAGKKRVWAGVAVRAEGQRGASFISEIRLFGDPGKRRRVYHGKAIGNRDTYGSVIWQGLSENEILGGNMVRRGLPMGRLDMNLLRSWRFVLPNHNSPRMSGGIITLMEAGMAERQAGGFSESSSVNPQHRVDT